MPYTMTEIRNKLVGRNKRRMKRGTLFDPPISRRFLRVNRPTKSGMYRLKGIVNITTNGSGVLLNAIRLTTPDNFDGASNSVTDWTSFANLYDQYRVHAIKVKWIPDVPNDESGTSVYKPIYVFTDYDSIGLSPTNGVAIGYDNQRTFNLYRPWTYYKRIPKLLNPGATNVSMLGYFDTLSTVSTGAVYLCQSGPLSISKTYGTCVVTYYLKGAMRR